MATEEQKQGMANIYSELDGLFRMLNGGNKVNFYLCLQADDNQDGKADFVTNCPDNKVAISTLKQIVSRLENNDFDEFKVKRNA